MGSCPTAYVYEERHRAEANARGCNYWWCYIEEILDELGVRAARVAVADMQDQQALARHKALLLGNLPKYLISAKAVTTLNEWVRQGGHLIGFITQGLDSIFGIKPTGFVEQPDDAFSVAAYLSFTDHSLSADVHSPLFPDQRLPIVSSVRCVEASADELAHLFSVAGVDLGYPAITRRQIEAGSATYFSFDLLHTVWAMHQGRPIDRDWDRDGYYRACDAIILPRTITTQVPYADALLLLLRNLLAEAPQPFIDALPPRDGEPADVLLHYGGDDECSPGVHVAASDFMRSRGLPYHINCMCVNGEFAPTDADIAHVRANGHELSLHPNFINPDGRMVDHLRIDEARLKEQITTFHKRFGATPVASVNHYVTWWGWSEPARWMAEMGCRGDNSRIHTHIPPMNPVNTWGFGFGTAFPYFAYDDAAHGNRRIPFVYLPIVFYEPGTGSTPDQWPAVAAEIEKLLDLATRYRWTLNLFLHPVYLLPEESSTRKAVDHFLTTIQSRGLRSVHMGTDAACNWWFDRSESCIEFANTQREGEVAFTVSTPSEAGVTILLPAPGNTKPHVTLDGLPVAVHENIRFGRRWILFVCPTGRHEVLLKMYGSTVPPSPAPSPDRLATVCADVSSRLVHQAECGRKRFRCHQRD